MSGMRANPGNWIFASLVVIVFTLSCAREEPADRTAATGGEPQDRLKRGETLSHIAGCVDCHTPGWFYGAPDWERNLSGSEIGWQGPWGVTYARNLTPDAETGIGRWSDEDVARAIRTGQRPDGTLLRPPMPWQSFAYMTDEDVSALVAYLRSIPAVKHKVPDALPPGATASGSVVVWPPPSPWDAPRTAPGTTPGAASDTTTHG